MEGTISVDIEEIAVRMKNWIDSAKDMGYWGVFVHAAINIRIPQVIELVNISI